MTAKRVDPKEANALLDQGWTYVDVRTEAEFAAQAAAATLDLRGAVAGGSRSAVTDAVVGPDSTEFLIAMAVDR